MSIKQEELEKIAFIYMNISNEKRNLWMSNGNILLASQQAEEKQKAKKAAEEILEKTT
ncbi:hypothetical protein [Velocimicrobium porci]|uniref:hypothetical protein n=1 Tax=Velocimicrobium porci TaxID=2606634 RepID=UPI0012B291A9|nr:hypothetical protein [Velocimicrobium porci]